MKSSNDLGLLSETRYSRTLRHRFCSISICSISVYYFYFAFTFLFISCAVLGCGRKAPPLPPEAYSAEAVKELEVTADLDGVLFRWEAPETDLRQEELESMDGYRIYRKIVNRDSDLFDDSIEYELLDTIEDTHILLRDELRKKAREDGKISRKVKVDPALKVFEYRDQQVQPGYNYLYKIVPINQGSVKGQTRQFVRVGFRGDASDVQLLVASDFDYNSF